MYVLCHILWHQDVLLAALIKPSILLRNSNLLFYSLSYSSFNSKTKTKNKNQLLPTSSTILVQYCFPLPLIRQ
jgi:hypothetical protein